jgi:hypothetical protein
LHNREKWLFERRLWTVPYCAWRPDLQIGTASRINLGVTRLGAKALVDLDSSGFQYTSKAGGRRKTGELRDFWSMRGLARV